MFKRFLRCISTLLVLVMLVNMVPVQALGELQVGGINTGNIETKPNIWADSAATATIVAEVPEGRSEYSKEFLLSNGLHMATVYADPVHYEKNGKWEDIDNTLVANLDGTYKNTAGPWEVSFPQSFGSNQAITVTKDGYTLSFGMPQKLTSGGNSGAMVMSANSTAETFATAQAATTTAQLDNKIELAREKLEAEHPETVLDKLSSWLTYENVHSDTNVIYDLNSNQVKESIVLEKQDSTLRGFRYTLNVGTMIPVLEEDGTILFYNEEQTQIVMVMPAPYLLDAAYEISNDIAVTLTGSDGVYTLTYVLPRQWLAAEERQWPVILDPVIQTSIDRSNIQDVLVCSNATISPYGSYLEVGYLSNRGISRTNVNFSYLPSLTSADVVVKAEMQMTQMWRRSISVPAEVHKVTSQWDQEQITWGAQPTYDETIVDFVMGNNAVDYYWDVTDIVQEWYNEGEHFGLLFKTSDSIENAGVEKFRQFYSCNYGYDYRPVLNIIFRNNNGLEGWWDYSSASAGRAGTGSVNIYSGNLVWTRSDMGFGGNLMPVSIGYTYNTNDAANNSFGMGYGWRNSFNQLVYQWDEDGDGTIQSDEQYYIWEDSDGTKHYFKKVSTYKYEDEDGMELTLNISGSGSSKTYTIVDKNGNTSYFDTQGRLYKLENNQKSKSSNLITYQDSTSKLIQTVTDGAGRVYQFHYGDDSLLDKVSFHGKQQAEISYVEYQYDNGDLTEVKYKDGKTATYAYIHNHLLESASDIDGYKLTYTYENPESDFAPPRVTSVMEEDNGVFGGKLIFQYEQNQTQVQSGYWVPKDESEILSEDDERMKFTVESTLYYQFNNFGNTVAIQDDEGRAQYADFARNDPGETTGKGNQLTLSSKLQNTVINYLSNSSFESGNAWTGGSIANTGYLGSKALCAANGTLQSPGITVKPGETYTFSGFVKVESGSAKLGITDGTTTHYSEETSVNDWMRLQVSYTNAGEINKTVYAVFTASATAYLDCVQFEEMPTASRYNLVNNGDFASADGWTPTGLTTADVVTAVTDTHSVLSPSAYKITGEYTTEKTVKQTIQVSGGSGDSYVFGGWAMGQSVALDSIDESIEKDFAIRCTIHYTDNTTEVQKVQFNSNVTQWQFVTGAIAAKKAYSSIDIEAVFTNNANAVCFDGLQLFKEEFGVSYTYDDEGNVISVIDLQKKNTTYEYQNNNLTKVIENGQAKMEYTYDDYHNVLTATTQEKLKYEFKYDAYGNNTEVSISVKDDQSDVTSKITAKAGYTDDGNQMAYTEDALGNKTVYGYNEQTGLLDWVQYPNDGNSTRKTSNTYDDVYRITAVTGQSAAEGITTQNLFANYTYNDEDLLTVIQTPTTTYSFEYGAFSLRSAVKVGNVTLATDAYEQGSNRLIGTTFANGDYVSYTYDAQGRLTKQSHEDGTYVTFTYDNYGNLATAYDSETGITKTYYYDLLNRQSGYREKSNTLDHLVKYEYNEDNNISSMVETINGVSKTYTYTYDEDNRITSETLDGVTVSYRYDGFGRLKDYVVKNGDTEINRNTLGYSGTETATSGQANSYNGLTYTYDSNGNILTISDGSHTTSYAYDSANQLIWEYNPAQGYAHNWVYDNADNIDERREYTYSNGQLSTAYTSVDYKYNNAQWGDLLTGYGKKNISYDLSGNPETYGNWSFNWKHGKQLATASDGTTVWNYSYNADGLRTKRASETNTYIYVYNGSRLSQMTVDGHTLSFTYGASGIPLTVTFDNETYYYVTSLQGDIIGILDADGQQVITYRYSAWGEVTCIGDESVGEYNPLLYRGYVYDRETGLYYLQSRYYNPEWGRFLNADNFPATGQGLLGNNMFAYCGNNPVSRADTSGFFWDTVFDVVSLVVSVVEVVQNPTDVGAWVGLVCDVVDVVVPVVTGLGETADAINSARKISKTAEELNDARKNTKKTLESIKTASESLNKGNNTVYVSYVGDTLEYVGITNDFTRRQREWEGVREIQEYVTGLDRDSARIIEQTVIDTFGMSKNGGPLSNKINSIGVRNPKYQTYLEFIRRLR